MDDQSAKSKGIENESNVCQLIGLSADEGVEVPVVSLSDLSGGTVEFDET